MKKQMDIKHDFEPSRYIATFAIATLLFILGIVVGYAITSNKFQNLGSVEETLRIEMLDFTLQTELAEQYPCDSYSLYGLGDRLEELRGKIEMLETQLGKNNKAVIELKKPYALLNIRHYLLIKKRVEKCREDYVPILFFYSNKPEYIADSEKQGYVLNYINDKYVDRAKVYAIDVDLDLGIINALKEIYSITTYPTIIIGDKSFIGFTAREDIEKEL